MRTKSWPSLSNPINGGEKQAAGETGEGEGVYL